MSESPQELVVEIARASAQQVFGIELLFDSSYQVKSLYIGGIAPNSPASKTSLKKGDRILRVNGALVSEDLRAAVAVLALSLHVHIVYSPSSNSDTKSSTPSFSAGSLVDVLAHSQWRVGRVRNVEADGTIAVELVVGLREMSLMFSSGSPDLQPLHSHTTLNTLGDEAEIFDTSMRLAKELSQCLSQPPLNNGLAYEPPQVKDWHSTDHSRIRDFIRLHIASIILRQAKRRSPEQLERMTDITERTMYERANSLLQYSDVSTLPDRIKAFATEMLRRKMSAAVQQKTPESKPAVPKPKSTSKVVEVINLISDEEDNTVVDSLTAKRSISEEEDWALDDVAVRLRLVDPEIELVPLKKVRVEMPSGPMDCEIEFVGGSFASTSSMPHQREACAIHPFKFTSHASNTKHCEFCYCYICDTKAVECVSWRNDHCHASTKNPMSKKEREVFNSPLFKILSRREVKDFWTCNKDRLSGLLRCYNRTMMEQLVRQFLRRIDEILRSRHTLSALIEAAALLLHVQKHCHDISDDIWNTVHTDLFDVICSPVFTTDSRRAVTAELDSLYTTGMAFNPHVRIFPLELVKALCEFDPEFSWVQTGAEIPPSHLSRISIRGKMILQAKLKSLKSGVISASIVDDAEAQTDSIMTKLFTNNLNALHGTILTLHSMSDSLWRTFLSKVSAKFKTPVEIVRLMVTVFQQNNASSRIKALMESQYLRLQRCELWNGLFWQADDVIYISELITKEALLHSAHIAMNHMLLKVAIALFAHTFMPFTLGYCQRFVSTLASTMEADGASPSAIAVVEYLNLAQHSDDASNLYLEILIKSKFYWMDSNTSFVDTTSIPNFSRLLGLFHVLFVRPEKLFESPEARALCRLYCNWALLQGNSSDHMEQIFLALWKYFHWKVSINVTVSAVPYNFCQEIGDTLHLLVSYIPNFSEVYELTPSNLDVSLNLRVLYRLRGLSREVSGPISHAKQLAEWKGWVIGSIPQSWDFWLKALKSSPLTVLECLVVGDFEQIRHPPNLFVELLIWDTLKHLWDVRDEIYMCNLLKKVLDHSKIECLRSSIDDLCTQTKFFEDMFSVQPQNIVKVVMNSFSLPLLSKVLELNRVSGVLSMDAIKAEFIEAVGKKKFKYQTNQVLPRVVIMACTLELYDIAADTLSSQREWRLKPQFIRQVLSSSHFTTGAVGKFLIAIAPKVGDCYWNLDDSAFRHPTKLKRHFDALDNYIRDFLQTIEDSAADELGYLQLSCYCYRSFETIQKYLNHETLSEKHREAMMLWAENAAEKKILSFDACVRIAAEYGNYRHVKNAVRSLPHLDGQGGSVELGPLLLRWSYDYPQYLALLLDHLFSEIHHFKSKREFLTNFLSEFDKLFCGLLSVKGLIQQINEDDSPTLNTSLRASILLLILLCDLRNLQSYAAISFSLLFFEFSGQGNMTIHGLSLLALMEERDLMVDVELISDVLMLFAFSPSRVQLSMQAITTFLSYDLSTIESSRLERLLLNISVGIVSINGFQSVFVDSSAYDYSPTLENLIEGMYNAIAKFIATDKMATLLALIQSSRQFSVINLRVLKNACNDRNDPSDMLSEAVCAQRKRWIECEGSALFKIMIFSRILEENDVEIYSIGDLISCLRHGVIEHIESGGIVSRNSVLDAAAASAPVLEALMNVVLNFPDSHEVLVQLFSLHVVEAKELGDELLPLIELLASCSNSQHLIFMYKYLLGETKFSNVWDLKSSISSANWEGLLQVLLALHDNKAVLIPIQEIPDPRTSGEFNQGVALSPMDRLMSGFFKEKGTFYRSINDLSRDELLSWAAKPKSSLIYVVVYSLELMNPPSTFNRFPLYALGFSGMLESTWKVLAHLDVQGFTDALLDLTRNIMQCIAEQRTVSANQKNDLLAYLRIMNSVLLMSTNGKAAWTLLLSQTRKILSQKKTMLNLFKSFS